MDDMAFMPIAPLSREGGREGGRRLTSLPKKEGRVGERLFMAK